MFLNWWPCEQKGRQSLAVVCVLQCVCASCPEAGRAGRDGGKMSLLQPEEQKSFGSKGYAAREEPHSSHPATPAQFSLSVPPLLNFKWTSFYSDVMVRGIENKRHG